MANSRPFAEGRPYQMDVQITYRVYAKVPAKGDLQPIQRKHRANHKGSMQMEGSRNYRGEGNGGSYPPAGIHSTKDECLKFHGIPEGKECVDDL